MIETLRYEWYTEMEYMKSMFEGSCFLEYPLLKTTTK